MLLELDPCLMVLELCEPQYDGLEQQEENERDDALSKWADQDRPDDLCFALPWVVGEVMTKVEQATRACPTDEDQKAQDEVGE